MMSNRPTNRFRFGKFGAPEPGPNPGNKGHDDYAVSTAPTPVSRLGRRQIARLLETLDERDFATLSNLQQMKVLNTNQLRRLHFFDAATNEAGTRAVNRQTKKLADFKLIDNNWRRIGGAQGGSRASEWHLTEGGHRLLNAKNGIKREKRNPRNREVSWQHLSHTLAIAEFYVYVVELTRKYQDFEIQQVEFEPDCWRLFTRNGQQVNLKPDLFISFKNGEYEERWFIEIDLSTESLPVVLTKARRYFHYYHTKREQHNHGVFPYTLWVVLDEKRKMKLLQGFQNTLQGGSALFTVATTEHLDEVLTGKDQNTIKTEEK